MALKAPFDEKIQLIEDHLLGMIPESSASYRMLFDSARYALSTGGKRLRPLLTLLTCEALGGDLQQALTPACCIEMIHTYSLIHDDLPCIDNDDMRRGKPTVHKVFTEGHALLTGDFLLTYAFEKISCCPLLSGEKKIELITLLAKASGADGLIGGQSLDISNKNTCLNIEELEEIHLLKTGKLLSLSLTFGALIANASGTVPATIERLGNTLGLAFQIVDDILDVTAGESKHGKKEGSDRSKNKSTYVTLLGIEGANRQAGELLKKSVELINTLPLKNGHLEEVARYLVERTY